MEENNGAGTDQGTSLSIKCCIRVGLEKSAHDDVMQMPVLHAGDRRWQARHLA